MLICANSDLTRFKELESLGVFNRGHKDNEELERLRIELSKRPEHE